MSLSKAKLGAGTYRVRVSTFDRAGNLSKLPLKSIKVK